MKQKLTLLVLLFGLLSQTAFAQTRQISGTVTGKASETLPGVSVTVKGTLKGTTTDLDGRYTITVSQDENTLVFSSVGYLRKEVTLGASNTVDVALEEDVKNLDEVVVTALGISREKKSLGYAVQEVSGDELRGSGEQNIIQAMSSKVAGVQVIGTGGTPGASSKILLRGNKSFGNSNQPLIVVDGVPIDNTTTTTKAGDNPFNPNLEGVNNSNRAVDLNPEDIESVTVLKGPAAAALYGVRAGNGAIVYTTKKGTYGQGRGIRVVFSTTHEFAKVNKLPELQGVYAQGTGGARIATDGSLTPGTYTTFDPGSDYVFGTQSTDKPGVSEVWGPRMSTLGITPSDNYDSFFKTGYTTTNNVSLTGGSENSVFRLSVGNTNQSGVVPNTSFDRTSVRLTAETQMSNIWNIGGTINYINSGGTRGQNGSNLSGVMLGLTRAPRSFDIGSKDDYTYPNGLQRQYFTAYDNPFWTAYENPFTDDVNRVLGNVYTNIQPLSWMKVTYKIGTDFYQDQRRQLYAIGSNQPPQGPTGQIEYNNLRNREVYSDLIVSMNKTLTDKINASLMLGNNIYQKKFQDIYSRGRTLGIPNFYNLDNTSDRYASDMSELTRTTALFFDAGFDYDNTLFLTFTGRNEWASTFGPAKNNFFYPSASAALVFTELMAENKILSFGKVRLGYAKSGIIPEPYNYNTYFVAPFFTDGFTDGLSFPYGGQSGFGYSDIIGSRDLRPEKVVGKEIGLDLRFFKGRFNVDFTYYNQKSSDILLYLPVAPSSGFEQKYTNSAEMVNKGIELVLDADVIDSDKLQWNMMVNFTRNRNEVTKLAPGVNQVDLETAFSSIHAYAIVGQPYGALYGTEWERTADGTLIINPATGLPYVRSKEANIGNPYPDWTAGIRNTFTYKNVSLTALLDIRQGGDIWNGTYARLNRLGQTEESAEREQKYVIPGVLGTTTNEDGSHNTDGVQNTTEIAPYTYFQRYVGDNGAAVEEAIQDGSWVRLRELSVNYRLPVKSSKFFKTIDLGLTGRNLWLSTDYKGVDPETSLTGAGSNVGGFDYFNMPGTRSWILSARFGF